MTASAVEGWSSGAEVFERTGSEVSPETSIAGFSDAASVCASYIVSVRFKQLLRTDFLLMNADARLMHPPQAL